jgi:hypothetical protein
MASKYAKSTRVPINRSRDEIEKTLQRYGAGKFGVVTEMTGATLVFQYKGRVIKRIGDTKRMYS